MGGGVGLAAVCDISLAAEDARFGFTEVRIGVAPAIIAVVCLPKLRRADALELFLGGERITAERAATVGLITRSVEPDHLDAEVAGVVAGLLRGAPAALAAAKELVYEVPARSQPAAFAWASELSAALFAGPEAAEGRQAFLDKRPPRWSVDDG
jgi:enoyl-CoA hydratase/carnithine racemase